MAPVGAGYCTLRDLEDGTITLWHLAMANDHLAIISENRRRASEK
jgi:hypothetical protein